MRIRGGGADCPKVMSLLEHCPNEVYQMDLVKTKIKSELRNGLTYVRQESYAILGRDMRCITVLQTKDTTHHFMNEEKYYRYHDSRGGK